MALLEAKIAKANNLSVRVITSLPGADSSDDDEGGAAVDLLVCEVMDPCLVGSTQVGLLGSGLLTTLKECRAAGILGPKTQVLPRAARVYAQAIFLPAQTELVRCPIGTVSTFDLSPFGKFRADGPEPVYLSQLKYTAITDPFAALDFDLSREGCEADKKTVIDVKCVACGLVNAIVFWHDLELDGEITLSAGPSSNARQGILMLDRDLVVSDSLGQLSITVESRIPPPPSPFSLLYSLSPLPPSFSLPPLPPPPFSLPFPSSFLHQSKPVLDLVPSLPVGTQTKN